jgi:hypothetical protein
MYFFQVGSEEITSVAKFSGHIHRGIVFQQNIRAGSVNPYGHAAIDVEPVSDAVDEDAVGDRDFLGSRGNLDGIVMICEHTIVNNNRITGCIVDKFKHSVVMSICSTKQDILKR